MRDLTISFGGVTALDGVTLTVAAGEVCALIGPNGAGKTSLFNCVCRLYEPNAGTITYRGADVLAQPRHRIAGLGIARTFQNLALFPGLTVLENVLVGAYSRVNSRRLKVLRGLGADTMALLDSLELADVAHQPCAGLPFGTMKRIELARALSARPSLLLLDEPANGLTHQEVSELAAAIRRLRAELDLTILLVEHHMGMVMEISDRIVVMDTGRVIATGSPTEIANDPVVIDAYLGAPA